MSRTDRPTVFYFSACDSGTNIATRIIAIEADKLPWHCDSEEDLLQELPAV